MAGSLLLTTKVGSGEGGARSGRLVTNATRKLKASDVEQILSLVAPDTEYWRLNNNDELDPTSSDGLITIQPDGARWIIEVLDGSDYHVVDRWSSDSGIIHELGTRFIALSGQEFGPVY
jgi:hypothetical protein